MGKKKKNVALQLQNRVHKVRQRCKFSFVNQLEFLHNMTTHLDFGAPQESLAHAITFFFFFFFLVAITIQFFFSKQ